MAQKLKPTEWQEPDRGQNAGMLESAQLALRQLGERGRADLPRHGVQRVQELPFKPWKRLGGRGTFIQLYDGRAMGLLRY
jgi:hypothetical protein